MLEFQKYMRDRDGEETPGPEARTPIAAGAAGMCAGHILFGVPDLFRSSGGCAAAALQAFGDVFLLRSDE